MAEYLIYFNQQWVGDHSEDWFRERGPKAMKVIEEQRRFWAEEGSVYFAHSATA